MTSFLDLFTVARSLLSGLTLNGQAVTIVNTGQKVPDSGVYVLLSNPMSTPQNNWQGRAFDFMTLQVDVYALENPVAVGTLASAIKTRFQGQEALAELPLLTESESIGTWYRSMQQYQIKL